MNHLGGRALRTARLARLSASTGGRLWYANRAGRNGHDARAFAQHDRIAEEVLGTLGTMKGAAMKLGQLLSYVDVDLHPEAADTYQARLAALREAAPPTDHAAVEQVIREDFGAPPEQVFASWDPDPVAVASIGQVHRAVLPTGEEVAVKVQHPGIAEAVEADLDNLDVFGRLARRISPEVDPDELLVELRERTLAELDYQQEARFQQAFVDRYAGHPFIRVPQVFHDWCRPRVLVLEYVQGRRFDDLLADPKEVRDRYGEIIFRFVFGSLYRFRLFNSDPHPGNFVFPDDGAVAFLDFGSSRSFSAGSRERLERVHRAVAAEDLVELELALRGAGILPEGASTDVGAVLAWFQTLREPMLADAPSTYTREYARRAIAASMDRDSPYLPALRKLRMPPEYLLLNRITFGVNSLLGRLEPTANWHRIMAELSADAPPSTPLGEAEAEFLADHPLRA